MFAPDISFDELLPDSFAVWIDALSKSADPDVIAAGYQARERMNAALTGGVGRLDAEDGYLVDGALNASAWLRNRVLLDSAEASRTVRIARRLRSLPVTEAAWINGEITSAQVAAIVETIGTDEDLAAAYVEGEPAVLALVTGRGVRHATFLLHHWRDVTLRERHPDPAPEPETRVSKVTLSAYLGGLWRLDGNLDPTAGNLVDALNTAIDDLPAVDLTPDPGSEQLHLKTRSELRAQGLAAICQFYLDHRTTKNAPRNRGHVIVDIACLARQAEGRAETISGVPLDRARIDQLLCDANIHRIVIDGPSVVLEQGRGTRFPTAEQWHAMVARDRHCAWPAGCHAPPSRCQAHHEPSWLDSGTSDVDAMRLLCNGHHWLRHQAGWTGKILPDGTYIVTNPHGKTFTSRPRC